MIRLRNLNVSALSGKTQRSLNSLQTKVGDNLSDLNDCYQRAKTLFKNSNIVSNDTFDEVKSRLITMGSGFSRCHYCEDNSANEIEHFRPQSLYPDLCFEWDNYLYSCGVCNRHKGNNFPCYNLQSETIVIERTYAKPLLINPRFENPLDYLFLSLPDEMTTNCKELIEMNQLSGNIYFLFTPLHRENPYLHLRAKHTIETLKLNRADLQAQRCLAFSDFVNSLEIIVHTTDYTRRNSMIGNLKLAPHQTVWHEMKRQRNFILELHQELFDLLPEALDW